MTSILERLNACGCTASECDGIACGTVVSTTVPEHSVADRYIVKKAPLDHVDVTSQEVIETMNVLVNHD